jgi:hypothetical protein
MFIGQTQPTHPLAVAQAHLLGGVHLPNVMGVLGAVGVGPGATSLGSWGQAVLRQPALYGAGRRQGLWVELVSQKDADERGAPGGVVASQLQGGLLQRRRRDVGERGAVAVGGPHGFGASVAEALEQAAHGAGCQAEGGGNGEGILAALPA